MAKKIVEAFLQNGVLMKRFIDGSVEVIRSLDGSTTSPAQPALPASFAEDTTQASMSTKEPKRRGQRGKAGVSVSGAKIKNNQLMIKLSDGSKINAGSILPEDAVNTISPIKGEFMTRSEAKELMEAVNSVDTKMSEAINSLEGEEIARRLEDIEFEGERLDYNSLKNKPNIKRIITSTGTQSGGGPGSVTASNGLNLVGADVQMGGLLTQNTVIDGDSQAYSMIFQSMDNFDWQDGTDWQVGGTGLGVANVSLIGESDMEIATSATGFVRIKTPAIVSATASNGQVLTLTNAVTGTVEYTTVAGLGSTNGVEDIGGLHGLGGALVQNTTIDGASNTYEMVWDTLSNFGVTAADTFQISRDAGATQSQLNGSATLASTGKDGIEMTFDDGTTELAYATVYDRGSGNPQGILGFKDSTLVSNNVVVDAGSVSLNSGGSSGSVNTVRINWNDGITIDTAVGDTFRLNEGTSGFGGTATNGQVLTLINTSLGEAKWADASGLPTASIAGQIAMYDGATYSVATPKKDKFTGIVISTVTLSATPLVSTDETIDVYKNGLLQEEGGSEDYTVSGTTVTFTNILIASDKVTVKYFA